MIRHRILKDPAMPATESEPLDPFKRTHLFTALMVGAHALFGHAASAAAAPRGADLAGDKNGAAYFPPGIHTLAPGERDLQAALDKHGSVRLGAGTFGNCVLRSGQHLRGIMGKTKVERVTVEPGAHGFSLMGVNGEVVFPASRVVTRDGFIGMRVGGISGRGAALERMLFFACMHSAVDLRDSRTEHCTWVHQQTHDGGWQSDRPVFVLSGQGSDNTIVAFNALGAWRTPLSVADQRRFAVIGFDEETYKPHEDGGPSLLLRNSAGATLVGMGGYPHGSDGLDADRPVTVILSDQSSDSGKQLAALRGGGSVVRSRRYAASAGLPNAAALPEGLALLAAWTRPPVIAPAPPHAGALPDDTAELQRLLDAGGEIVLAPRAYGVNSTLRAPVGATLSGTWGRTTLVAQGTFPLLKIDGTGTVPLNLYDIQLQGGSVGVHITEPGLQLNAFAWSGVTFRGQTLAGVLLDRGYAIDNAGMYRCAFVDCAAGLLQMPVEGEVADRNPSLAYIDKFHALECLFEGCGRPLDLRIRRADNLVTWTRCTFRHNRQAPFIGSGANYPIFVGCQFIGAGSGGLAIDSGSATTVIARCFFEGAHGIGDNLALNCEFA